MGDNAFGSCSKLTTVILGSNTLCTINKKSYFYNTPIHEGTGFIYVPRALIDSYKADTYWATYSSQFRAIEDYPEICGGDN
jgi:hypothetical protein